jgi:transposase
VIPDEKDRLIAELRSQLKAALDVIGQLQKRVSELEEKLGKDSSNSSKPPSSDPPWAKPKPKLRRGKKRKRGGQPGHPRNQRPLVPPDKVDRIIAVKPSHCDGCGVRLIGEDAEPERHQIFEVPHIEAKITEYQLHTLECACGACTTGKLPEGAPRGSFGPNLVALVCWLTGKFRLSKRGVQELLSDLLRTDVSLGAVSKMEREASAALSAPVEEARAYVREQDVAHGDETGWRECNKKAWLWVAVTPLVAVFEIARSRGADIAKSLLGAAFAGILVSDRWSAYRFIDATRRQLCWAHLLRDFQAFVDRGGTSKRIGEALLEQARKMFKWWHKVRDGTMSRESFQRKMLPVIDQVSELLAQGARCHTRKTAGTCAHILGLEWALWTFLFVDEVEPTNNFAERVLRAAVLWRKTSFGTQSEAGSRFVERILTVTTTLKLQDRHVLTYLTEAIQAHRHGDTSPSLLPEQGVRLEIAA